MSHKPNFEEANEVGVDRKHPDYVNMHDEYHGCYSDPVDGKTTAEKPAPLPAEPKPFDVKK